MKNNKIRMMIFDNLPLIFAWILQLVLAAVVLSWNVKPIQAYLTDKEEAVNELVIGNNKIIVEETFETPEAGKRTIKKPMAKNTGNTDCYVRGKVIESDSRMKAYLTYYNGEIPGFNQNGWKPDEDGWMYYQEILKVNETTLPLFTHIELAEEFPQELFDFSIEVVFESVQSEHFSNAKEAFSALEDGGVK